MHTRIQFSSERGFMSPLAAVVALLVCVALGYAMVKGFSATSAPAGVNASLKFARGERLDAPLPGAKPAPAVTQTEPQADGTSSNQPPIDGDPSKIERPALPDPETVAEPVGIEDLGGDVLDLPFAKISNYRYIFPDVEDGENIPDQIPESIKKLNGRKVSIRGFMLPVTQKDGRVTEFLLLKDQSLCCFGTMPQMNEWVHVIMTPGQSAPMVWDLPVTVFGTFEVGEVFENGVLMTIYRLRYEKLVRPELAK